MPARDHVSLLADLVRRPSVNPMGRDVSGPEYLEGRVTEFLAQRLTAAGIPWARQQVAPGRYTIVARLEATTPAAPVILWDAHQDTVSAEGMTIEPFTPLIRDGRMYGRGTCDVKGGLAAMLAALERLAAEDGPRHATVVLAATVGEEFGFLGALALSRLWGDAAAEKPADVAARELLGGAAGRGDRGRADRTRPRRGPQGVAQVAAAGARPRLPRCVSRAGGERALRGIPRGTGA